ncbi:hypothetical protein DYQ86_13305 [Acidobacteria bacterium AB60]|nr:hypothetical protein DYQ86_13305 [Acidobacteria bacterium AB60]
MKNSALLLCFAVPLALPAQTAQKPAAPASKPAGAHAATQHASASAGVKLPPGVPPVTGPINTAFALRYQDIKIGTGAEAQPFKIYKVFYTGYRAADGVKFDSSDDHRSPIATREGKAELGPDGKPKMGPPEPLAFAQGTGRLIPGFDQGFNGMRVGGKRRLFIPWQLAYGTRNLPDQPAKDGQPAHPGIPPKSDLIFDVELVDVADLPAAHPPMGGAPARPAAPAGQPSSDQNPPSGSNTPATPAPAPQPAAPPQPQN